jgi:GntR family transcriptional regulator, carbon starvation induced regulator
MSAGTRGSALATAIRNEILEGRLRPGDKLHIDETRKRFDVSLSPLREALSRLSAEGLVQAEDQRGFRVAPVSSDNCREVTRLRCLLETMALREAIALADRDWRDAVAEAWAALRLRSHGIRDAAWETAHEHLHITLISGCRLPMLVEFIAGLHHRSDRYRRLFLQKRQPDRNAAIEHEQIITATLDGEAELATALLGQHIRRTGNNVLRYIEERNAGSA